MTMYMRTEETKKKDEMRGPGWQLLRKNPQLRTQAEVTGSQGDWKALCELLKRNAIATRKLNLNGERWERKKNQLILEEREKEMESKTMWIDREQYWR